MTTVPTWVAICAAVGTPLLAFFGVLAAQFITRRGAHELEMRSKREETLRVLRWAAELAMSDDPARVRLGLAQLDALGESELLDSANSCSWMPPSLPFSVTQPNPPNAVMPTSLSCRVCDYDPYHRATRTGSTTMTDTVYVTSEQVLAAQIMVKRDRARGRATDPGVAKIANARPATPEELEAFDTRDVR